MKIIPPHLQGNSNHGVVASKPPRSSNLELYRILCMLLISSASLCGE